jgi:hypothetical protein
MRHNDNDLDAAELDSVPRRPEDTLPGMSSETIQAELLQHLENMGVVPPEGFSAMRNEHVRAIMGVITPFKADSSPLSKQRTRMNRILMLMLELRARDSYRG